MVLDSQVYFFTLVDSSIGLAAAVLWKTSSYACDVDIDMGLSRTSARVLSINSAAVNNRCTAVRNTILKQ